jgi:hypothetical protein
LGKKAETERIATENARFCPDCQKQDAYLDAHGKFYCPNCKIYVTEYTAEKTNNEWTASKKAAAEKLAIEQFEAESAAAEQRKKAAAERLEAQRIADEKEKAELQKKRAFLSKIRNDI